jgi:hypothetical protein
MRVLVRPELVRCPPCGNPATRQRWEAYKPNDIVETVILGRALAVAVKGSADDWAGYIGCGSEEEVARGGHKLPVAVATAIFDDCIFACGAYRR